MIKHHMIDFLDPMIRSNVINFRNQAIPIIDELRKKGLIPVICGGTNYYIESLLWNIIVGTEDAFEPVTKMPRDDDGTASDEQLYANLKEIDPDRAKELLPSDRRRILTSLAGETSLKFIVMMLKNLL